MHDHRRRNVPVEISTAITTVSTIGECLDGDLAARRALLTTTSRIDLDDLTPSVRRFGGDHRDESSPRGVIHVLGVDPTRQAFDVEILDRYPAEPIDDFTRELVTVIRPRVGDVFFHTWP